MSSPEINLYYWDGASYTSFNAPIQSISITRGRSRQLNRFQSGSAVINFYDFDRKLDPLNNDSNYQSLVKPRVEFKIEANSQPIFTGVVKDWDLQYDIAEKDTATAYCSDALTILSNLFFTEDTTFLQGTCGKRFDDVLTYFDYSGPTSINDGNANLSDDIVKQGTQCADYLFRVAESDGGNFFVSASGGLNFVGRYGRDPISTLTFADDGSGIPYSSLENQYGDELLFNQISISSDVGSSILENTTSINSFGLSILKIDHLLNAFVADFDALTEYLLKVYGEPEVRFTGLKIELAGLSQTQINNVLALDLADQISVKKTFRSGSPSSITQNLIVTGINHRIFPKSHIVEFSFENSSYATAFTLNDNNLGVLNTDNLG